jgi:hypothetical protein
MQISSKQGRFKAPVVVRPTSSARGKRTPLDAAKPRPVRGWARAMERREGSLSYFSRRCRLVMAAPYDVAWKLLPVLRY